MYVLKLFKISRSFRLFVSGQISVIGSPISADRVNLVDVFQRISLTFVFKLHCYDKKKKLRLLRRRPSITDRGRSMLYKYIFGLRHHHIYFYHNNVPIKTGPVNGYNPDHETLQFFGSATSPRRHEDLVNMCSS